MTRSINTLRGLMSPLVDRRSPLAKRSYSCFSRGAAAECSHGERRVDQLQFEMVLSDPLARFARVSPHEGEIMRTTPGLFFHYAYNIRLYSSPLCLMI